MRKILILITVLMVATIPATAAEGWTQNQTTANQIANLARGMGLQETNSIIQEASRIWWAEEQAKQERAEAERQAFLDVHYSDAVMMAKTMYGEAKGIGDKRELSMICWTILNRYESGRFGGSISAIITSPRQFAYRASAPTVNQCGVDLLALSQDVLSRWYREKQGEADVGRTLPPGYCFYYGDGRHNYFRTSDRGKGYLYFEGYGDPYQ